MSTLTSSDPAAARPTEPPGDDGANEHGYRRFAVGELHFERDEFFAHISWPTGSHVMSVDAFLRALQRDVAWNFFYGIVNFDGVFGTVNHYGTVDVFSGRYNDAYRKAELDHMETVDSDSLRQVFVSMLDDWTNEGFDPFASPSETGDPFGDKHGSNTAAVTRRRVTAARMVSLPGDEPCRDDADGHPINRQFADVAQDEPDVRPEPGYEGRIGAFNLAAYLSRSPVTWNPSVVSVCQDSLMCPTTEEYILPIIHGNDRVEWFVVLSDEIIWDIEDRDSGAKRAKVTMKAGDVSAMPADIRHQGFAPKRSMLLVWENASAALPALIAAGEVPVQPVEF
ncbi:MAG: hydroxyquinol 1,2-dioxygenase [Acidimicrobiales bacterium]